MHEHLTQLSELQDALIILVMLSTINVLFHLITLLEHLCRQKHKTNVEVYKIRLETYKTLRDIFDSIYETGKVIENHELAKLSRMARFIFGKDISDFVSNFNYTYLNSRSYCAFEQFDKRFIKYFKI